MSRPSDYSDEITGEICRRIAEGESLRKICFDNPDLPHWTTVLRWLDEYPDFASRYGRAREAQGDLLASDIIDIADDSSGDDGNDSVQRSRLQVDARKWFASKVAPKKYGDKLEAKVEHDVTGNLFDLLKAIDGRTRGLPTGS